MSTYLIKEVTNKMKKKSLLIIISLILVLTLPFVGCSSNGDGGTTTGTMDTFSFAATLHTRGVDDSGTVAQEAWLEKMGELMGMNVDIKFTYIPAGEYDTKINVQLSSLELDDFFMLPFIYDYTQMANQGYFLDMAKYDMTNYLAIIDKVPNGRMKLFMESGMFPALWQVGLPTVAENAAPQPLTGTMWNYSALQEMNLEPPGTLDELYEVSKAIKAEYPNSYPLNVNYIGVFSVFMAYHVYANQNGAGTLYWNGEEYTFAGLQPEYKLGVEYWNMMTKEGLFDPEYIIDTVDTVKSKMLNRENFLLLNTWRTHPEEYTRDSGTDKFVLSLIPNNPDYGLAYQTWGTDNQFWMTNWTMYAINEETKEPELLTKFIDLQFIPDVYEITSWGVKDVTYTVQADGTKKFIDEFYEAADPAVVADKYGLWNDRSGRANPGLRVIQDNTARADSFPNPVATYFGGKYEEADITATEYFKKIAWPNEHIPPWYQPPAISLTEEESATASAIITQLQTYTAQMQAGFISGEHDIDSDWDSFINTFKNSYDLQKVLDIYNAAAERYFASAGN